MSISQLLVSTPARSDTRRYSLLVARTGSEIRAAQRLRHRVFADEMGATLHSRHPGLDVDAFDEHCDHLLVREERTGEIVGTYRMLAPEGARQAGGLYCDTEFDLSALDGLRAELVETGRSCVDPEHRSGAVVSLVWAGIARYMLLTGHRWLVGCGSVPLRTPGQLDGAGAAGVWDVIRARHLAPDWYRVRPHRAWDTDAAPRPDRAVLPPLLRGYLRLGARVCGPPAHDPDFGVADFLVLLDLKAVDARYVRHFLGAAA
ncbi:MAG TPA: GNAT family N-acyltransferase [Pseudonocardiaceae bacterium]|jgi:putative hemolysin|nr:GNAT family N-acyltransferase [Pseudonocardiaceae bacterium]